jgi:CubicO group peptidase (beta-lactamase class C family)
MLALSLAGVWAAFVPPAFTERWVPESPAVTEHYFLVVTQNPDGSYSGFVRNPEHNLGGRIGTMSVTADADGNITLQKVGAKTDLRFHRATETDLRWFYPLQADRWTYGVPAAGADGWPVGTLQSAGMREVPIAEFMNSIAALRSPTLRSAYIQSVAIERHGTLVLDQYFYGFTPDTPHDVRSAGKSVTTLMVGRAIEDTHAFSPESRVLSILRGYLPVKNENERKQRMTVANLMTMAPGFACNDNDDSSPGNEDTMQSQPAGSDWYRYTLDLPMVAEPGTHAVYCSAGINLLGAIVHTATNVPLDEYFHDRFAAPMSFGTYAMWLMPPPADQAYMGGGDYFRPRDFLKFGQLILDRGRWGGNQIVDPQWIAQSIVPRTAPEGEGDRYGYGWHLVHVDVDGRGYDVVNAGGNGGQLMIAIPALDVAIMVTAGNYNQYPVWRNFLPDLTAVVVRSCVTKDRTYAGGLR